jgi:hypothetical protein
MTAPFVLQLLALICLFIAAIGIPTNRIAIGWLGLFFWFLATLLK